jgi:hypothetical protein
MITPSDLERHFTLLTAASRHDELRARETLAPTAYEAADEAGSGTAPPGPGATPDRASPDPGTAPPGPGATPGRASPDPGAALGLGAAPDPGAAPLTREEALELLALSEVIARKASYGRQLTVRSARWAGASWSQIGAALGTTKQAAWEAHNRWIDGQAEQHRRSDYQGLDAHDVAAARALAGQP